MFGVLAEGRMGMQRESERNLFASWDCAAQCHFTSYGCKALAMLYNLFSTLELPEMVQAVRCLRMSTHVYTLNLIQHWIQTSLTNRRNWWNWWNGFMDSWIHEANNMAMQCAFKVVGHLKTLYPALWDAASFGGILFVLGMSQCSIAQREAWTLGRCSGIGGRGHWIH